jgi:hypothetical protein
MVASSEGGFLSSAFAVVRRVVSIASLGDEKQLVFEKNQHLPHRYMAFARPRAGSEGLFPREWIPTGRRLVPGADLGSWLRRQPCIQAGPRIGLIGLLVDAKN